MNSSFLLIAAASAFALATTAQAQVKIGANPATISTNAVLDAEGTSGQRAVMLQNGNFGIGTATPFSHLSVVSNGAGDGTADDFEIASYNTNPSVGLYFKSATGTQAAPANVPTNNNLGVINFAGQVNGSMNNLSTIAAFYTGTGTNNLSTLVFGTSAAERMRIASDGNVGIGTSAPTTRLDINGGNGTAVRIQNGGDILMTADNDNTQTVSQYCGSNADQYQFVSNRTGTNRFIINFATGATAFSSDRRLKENITTLRSALSEIMKVRPVRYNSIGSDPVKDRTYGFIAQELKEVLPHLVFKNDDDDKYSVSYDLMIPILTRGMQEQQAQIETLKAQVIASQKENVALKEQATEVASLRSELDAIKALVLKGSSAQKNSLVTKK